MAHRHADERHAPDFSRAFAVGIVLNVAFVAAELVFGFIANSLALIADAGHNFSDVVSLIIAGAAAWIARWPPTPRRTYGYKRASILAALINAGLLFVAVGAILFEAVRRLWEPQEVASLTVLAVAALGAVINAATALLFLRGRHSDLNVRGAFVHMAADAAVSVGVVVAAVLILLTGWLWLDPVVSIVIAFVILWSSWGLARDSANLALDMVPKWINRTEVESYLAQLPGVAGVHDLHIWPMSTTETALTAHLVRPGAGLDDGFLGRVCRELEQRFGIRHATIQVEAGDPENPCGLAPEETV